MSKSEKLFEGIKSRDITALSRAITLIESRRPEHQIEARKLLKLIYPLTGNAKRMAVSGTPGVGKSTFIENFGMFQIELGRKVAVLAIDPTSQRTGGSILGDKTRMTKLSAHPDAFIRPTPNGDTLGGIAAKTREAMLLCDAFGFDTIFIETVGVGQSELSVSHLVDFFVLLMQPGSGDELQGIKRGILEVSDLVLIHKADGENKKLAKIAEHDFKRSLAILQNDRSWQTPVLACSSLEKSGFDEVEKTIEKFFDQYDKSNRKKQLKIWLKELLKEQLEQRAEKIDFQDNLNRIYEGKSDVLGELDLITKEIFRD